MIQGMLYERTAISRKPRHLVRKELAALRDEHRVSPDLIFRDPSLLDVLGLKNTHCEKDLEAAILSDLGQFLVEPGSDFSFVARQKRITGDHEDYYPDLLFFHRRLRRLVADLKLGRFRATDKRQMERYPHLLEQHDMQPGEDSPLGLILCAGKSNELVELLQLEKSGIRVAEYMTELPPRKTLERRLHEALQTARERFNRTLDKGSASAQRNARELPTGRGRRC